MGAALLMAAAIIGITGVLILTDAIIDRISDWELEDFDLKWRIFDMVIRTPIR